MDINQLLTLSAKRNASDLHLSAGLPPMIRLDGDICRLEMEALGDRDIRRLLHTIMEDQQRRDYETALEVDFAIAVPGVARFRVNAFNHRRGAGAVFRTIPSEIPTLEALGLGAVFQRLASQPRGLVLVTGPTGSGKSTTLAALVDFINATRREHILTIEDPVEFIHGSKRCLIHQREVHRDTRDFASALRSALREDPDVILVGELRDPQTIRLALTAAETGHLVLGSLHTTSAAKTIDRIIDVFPGDEQMMVRSMLSESLQGVVSQTLLKRRGGGRVAAHEILVMTTAIRNLIREDKVAQIYSTLQTGGNLGMCTLDAALMQLVSAGQVDQVEAQSKAKGTVPSSSSSNSFAHASGSFFTHAK